MNYENFCCKNADLISTLAENQQFSGTLAAFAYLISLAEIYPYSLSEFIILSAIAYLAIL